MIQDKCFNSLAFCGHTSQEPNGAQQMGEIKGFCAVTQPRKVIQFIDPRREILFVFSVEGWRSKVAAPAGQAPGTRDNLPAG